MFKKLILILLLIISSFFFIENIYCATVNASNSEIKNALLNITDNNIIESSPDD
jgi:hypothetical protein